VFRKYVKSILISCALVYLQLNKLFYWIWLEPFYKSMLDAFNGPIWGYVFPYWPGAIAPYSVMWYGFYFVVTRSGYFMMGIYLWILDNIFVYIVSRFKNIILTFLFSISSLVLFRYSPGDLLILWIAVLGYRRWYFSIISALTKLPFPAPYLYVWQYVFSDYSLFGAFHSSYYFLTWRYWLLGLWIIHPSFFYMKSHWFSDPFKGWCRWCGKPALLLYRWDHNFGSVIRYFTYPVVRKTFYACSDECAAKVADYVFKLFDSIPITFPIKRIQAFIARLRIFKHRIFRGKTFLLIFPNHARTQPSLLCQTA